MKTHKPEHHRHVAGCISDGQFALSQQANSNPPPALLKLKNIMDSSPQAARLAVFSDWASHKDSQPAKVKSPSHAAAQRKSNTGTIATQRQAVVQCEWIAGSEGVSHWSQQRGGLQWYYRSDGKMSFQIANISAVSQTFLIEHGDQAGTWKPHQQWMAEVDWGPEPVAPQKGEEKKEKEDGRSGAFDIAESDGKRKAANILNRGKGVVHPETQHARNQFFNDYYDTTVPAKDGDIRSRYKFPSKTSKYKGTYQNTFSAGGELRANENYAESSGREMYYDPVSKTATRMSNSEIICQQYKRLGVEAEPIQSLIRSRVSGPGLPILKMVRDTLGKREVVLLPDDRGFHALLTTPNCTAALWLIADHGKELGLQSIESIAITGNASLVVKFVRTPAQEGATF
jgi:hypothetical protein